MVSLNAEVNVDHNVQAFRVSVLKMSIDNGLVYPLVDTKFWWSTSVWSHSVNNPAYPETKQYTCSGSKLAELKKWDILFVWIRISSTTHRPKTDQWEWLNAKNPQTMNNILYPYSKLAMLWSVMCLSAPCCFWMPIMHPRTPAWFNGRTRKLNVAYLHLIGSKVYFSPWWLKIEQNY